MGMRERLPDIAKRTDTSMKKNIIIMTSGLAGSSVLTALLARAGYWTGAGTFKKLDYDTHENQQLIKLNKDLLKAARIDRDYTKSFDRADVVQVARAADIVDPAPYERLIEECQAQRPWIWKDPRLWLTIRVWRRWLDLESIQFVLITREIHQTWVSTAGRGQIQTKDFLRRYMDGIRQSIVEFFEAEKLPYLPVVYEDLLVRPEQTLERINGFLGTHLGIDDLRAVYKGQLYRRPRGLLDSVKAYLKYWKNYAQRAR
jgi:hypothetical protein